MKKHLLYILMLAPLVFAGACTKVINLDLPAGKPLPYIDAWITDQPGVQTIRFLNAANFLDSAAPAPISGAQVTLTDLTAAKTYTFNYSNGAYTYNAGATAIGIVNHAYKLGIVYNGQPFEAIDTLKRVAPIDSITVEFKSKSSGHTEGYYAKLYATDLPGGTDYYWIRTYKNGALNYYIHDMFSIDGAFREDLSDGFQFITPFRDGITDESHPYVKGDSLTIVLRSLTKGGHDFWERAANQLENGGLFARILENVPNNMKNLQAGSSTAIYGWFGMVAETRKSKVIQ
ncbi:MAG TPA: DUF4249 domain-containing protein [Chitinophagaceae bacterium]|nr:DUF4249 domain-containing protein [Chitinophagaceae bacterium]